MGILTGEEIKREVAAGNISVTPYEEKNVQPASIDLRLGTGIKIYADMVNGWWKEDQPLVPGSLVMPSPSFKFLDPKKKQHVHEIEMDDRGFILKPGILYLMHTHERIHTNKYVSVLDGKSSIGRLGVVVHLTAGYGDPGFDGQYTLEVTCIHPVILYPRMKIAQMRFHAMQGEVNTSYASKGHYVGDRALGAIPSMAHKQFEDG